MFVALYVLLAASPRDNMLHALTEGPDATFLALQQVPRHSTDDLRAARRWASLRAADTSPLAGLRRERLWESADCLVALPAALLLWREATARDVGAAKSQALASLNRCHAEHVWRPSSSAVATVDWHWLDEVGLRDQARARVAAGLAEDASWTWAFARVELGEDGADFFAALSRGEWAQLSSSPIGAEADAVFRALALEESGHHADAVAAVGDAFSGRLMAGHPLLYVLQSVASALRGAPLSMNSFCALSERHALRRWAQTRAPAARCDEVADRLWELPLW